MRVELTRNLTPYSIATIEYGDNQSADCSVVFLHGWLDNAASFESVMAPLHRMAPHLHLCAIDLPGHGLSEHKQSDNFYPFHDYMDDIHRLLLNLSASKLVLVGHSLGALIASCYSAAFARQVDGLMQIEGYGPLAENEADTVARLRDGVLSRHRIRNKPARMLRSVEDAVARRAKVNEIEPRLIEPIVKRGIEPCAQGWSWRHDVKLQAQSLYRMSYQHAEQIRRHIVCPQTIVLGERGYQHLADFAEDGSHLCQFETISGGHHCHLEQPDRVAELILGLVNKI